MKKYYRIAYVLLFICPIIIMTGAVIRAKHKGVVYHVTDPGSLRNKWNAETFSAINQTQDFENQIRTKFLDVTGKSTELTKEQQDKLLESLRLVLLAYHTGDYEDYERFRFPVSSGNFDTNRTSEFMSKIAAIPQYCGGLNTNDLRAVVKKLWETYGAMGKVYCTTCWTDVAISSIRVEKNTSANDRIIPNVTQTVVTNENIGGSVTIRPFFRFTPSESDIVEKYGVVTTATVSAIIRDDTQSSYPVYIQYYWSDQYRLWLPRNIALAYWNQKQLFLF